MFHKVQVRLFLSLAVLITVVLLGLMAFQHREMRRIRLVFNEMARDREETFNRLLELKGSSLTMFAYDYTYWDEMVRCIAERDTEWADEQVAEALETYKADGVWVYGLDRELVYTAQSEGMQAEHRYILPDSTFAPQLEKERFCHFFIKTPSGVMEVRGATVHPGNDPGRETPARGFFLAGRLWDGGYIADLSKLTESKVALVPVEGAPFLSGWSDARRGEIVTVRVLNDHRGNPLAVAQALSVSYAVREFNRAAVAESALLISAVLAVLALVAVASMVLVTRPLNLLSRSLADGSPEPLRSLASSKTEFGALARLVGRFFEQKQKLVDEIAEHKRTEQALRESEEHLHDLFENTSDIIQCVKPDGSLLYVNRAWRETLGYSEEEAKSLSLQNIIHPDSMTHCFEVFKQVMQGETALNVNAVFVAKDGRRVEVEGNANSRFEDGKPVYSRGIFRDVTERKRAEEALHHRLGLERLVAEVSGRFVSADRRSWNRTVDEALAGIGGFSGVDRCYLFQFNFDCSRMANTHEWCASGIESQKELLKSVGVSEFRWLTSRLLAGQTVCLPRVREMPDEARLELEWLVENGILSLILVPLCIEGRCIGFIGFDSCRAEKRWSDDDIFLLRTIGEILAGTLVRRKVQSALVAHSAELERLNRELAAANELKNQFLGMAAHDLRNPLSVVMSASSFMLDDAGRSLAEEKKTLFLERIYSNSEFMLKMIDDLLDVSRIESGNLKLEKEEVDLAGLIEQNVVMNRVQAVKKEIDIEFEPPSALPQVRLDRARMEQVLNNLVSNAVKFSSAGTVVSVSVGQRDGAVVVSVQDHGPGIPSAELGKLFLPFSKTSVRSTAGEKSTGLGLAISRKIVEAHGGKIWAESEVGRGSIFRFSLPTSDE